MDDDDDNGLPNIEFSDEEVDVNEKASRRTGQTEEQFQAVKQTYQPKVENGNIYKTISLPLSPSPNKQHLQELIHALDELYFFRRYQDAINFIDEVLSGGDGGHLDVETKDMLRVYDEKCKQRIKSNVS